ncbi:hypothetical protein [Salisediminibacterium selenitireducens]|nr:hypothetical protein [Salisediminibacterium selenitireducens]
MNKSELLDVMRREVGMSYDRAVDRDDFLVRIMDAIHLLTGERATVSAYEYDTYGNNQLFYQRTSRRGQKTPLHFEGWTGLSEAGHIMCMKRNDCLNVMIPVMKDDRIHVRLTISIETADYEVTIEDFIFCEELIYFIQSKRSRLP